MFCSNCGKEVPDNAYVCTGCGCLVGGKKPAAATEEKAVAVGGKNTKLSVFVLLSVASVALSLLFFTLSIALSYYGGYYGSYGAMGLWFDEVMLMVSFYLTMLLVLPAGIITFIFGIKEKQNAALKLIANITFIVCVAVFITIFAVAICQL